MDVASLDGMKRAELQNLAKKAGIKANKKTEYLITELKKYYSENNNGSFGDENVGSSQSEPDTCSSQTDTCTTTTTESETATESETETKPKATKGKRGRKAASRKKTMSKSSSESEAESSVEESQLGKPVVEDDKQDSEEADTEKTPSPPKRTTKARRGRKGRKRPTTPSPAKEATPAKIQKASPVQEKTVTPKPATPVMKVPSKTNTPAPVELTPHIETTRTSRGSSIKRSAQKAATPAADTKTTTPEVTFTKAIKPTTKSSSGRKTSKRRRSTFEVDPKTPKPTTEEVKKETKEIKADPKMKEAIMAEIEKKVQEQKPKQPTTRIPKPRFGTKPVTPGKNWAKIHAAKMNNMESIDDYLERKRKRTETMYASVKRAKIIAEESKAAMETLKAHRTPPVKGKQGPKIVKPVTKTTTSFMSPRPTTKPVIKARKSVGPVSFMSPAALKTAGKCVSFKFSKLKTPQPALARKNSCQKRISTPGLNKSLTQSGRKSVGDAAGKRKSLTASVRKSIGDGISQRKSIGGGTTPFKFGGNQLNSTLMNSTLSAKKPVFDLKASLSKGLAYKPHAGKLKPLGEINSLDSSKPKAKVQLKMHANITKAKGELKKPKIMSRAERRAGAQKHRAGKRTDDMMARRGIKM